MRQLSDVFSRFASHCVQTIAGSRRADFPEAEGNSQDCSGSEQLGGDGNARDPAASGRDSDCRAQ